jgi:choline oxidase
VGIDNVFIADASVFPEMVGVNPNLTVMMIGERCAALIAP